MPITALDETDKQVKTSLGKLTQGKDKEHDHKSPELLGQVLREILRFMGFPCIKKFSTRLTLSYVHGFLRLVRENMLVLRDYLWIKEEWFDNSELFAALLSITRIASEPSPASTSLQMDVAVDILLDAVPSSPVDYRLPFDSYIVARMIFFLVVGVPTFAMYNPKIVAGYTIGNYFDAAMEKPKVLDHEWTRIITEWRERALNPLAYISRAEDSQSDGDDASSDSGGSTTPSEDSDRPGIPCPEWNFDLTDDEEENNEQDGEDDKKGTEGIECKDAGEAKNGGGEKKKYIENLEERGKHKPFAEEMH
ncbi:hypothetical protein ABW20_dc0102198 [Dactylellina cionopaga]|nr:hypothetical protein ABW20_dc0102198 [Dactylellina cionopaga]